MGGDIKFREVKLTFYNRLYIKIQSEGELESSTVFQINEKNSLVIKLKAKMGKNKKLKFGPFYDQVLKRNLNFKHCGRIAIVTVPKKRKNKWGQLWKDMPSNRAESEKKHKKRGAKRQMTRVRSTPGHRIPVRRNMSSRKKSEKFNNEKEKPPKFEKIKKTNSRRSISTPLQKESLAEFNQFTERYNHLPMFSKSSRKKISSKILGLESGEIHESPKKEAKENLCPLFFVSKTFKYQFDQRNTYQNIRTKRGRKRKNKESMETKRFVDNESHVSSIVKKSKSVTRRNSRKKISRQTASTKLLRKKKSNRNSLKNLRRDKSNPVLSSQNYKDVEIKRRRARIQATKIQTKREISRVTSRKMHKKRGKKSNFPLVDRFDKTQSYDTLDQTYGMVKLKADSTLMDLRSDMKRQSWVEYFSKNTAIDCTLLQNSNKSSILKNIIPPLNLDPQGQNKYSSIFCRNKNRQSDTSYKMLEEISPILQIPTFKQCESEPSLSGNETKESHFDKLRKALPETNLVDAYKAALSKSETLRMQKLIILELQNSLKNEQKQRLSCERELLSILEGNQKTVDKLEREMEESRLRYSTPVKILEGIVGHESRNSNSRSSIRRVKRFQQSLSKQNREPETSAFQCIKNKYKLLLEMD